jgi:dUTP pyrophosphatase
MKFYLDPDARERGVTGLVRPRPGDAGYDVRSAEEVEIPPRELVMLRTGLHVAIPEGWVGLLKVRSSLASRKVFVHSGVIDSSYRGEIVVIIENGGDEPYKVCVNDRVVQMVIVLHYDRPVDEVYELDKLGETPRGEEGFGSTGMR